MAELSAEARPGERFGKYEIAGFMARGALGSVYKAIDTVSGSAVAIKILNREIASDEEMVMCFKREARLLTRFAHPNILKVIDFGLHAATFFIVMDLIEGDSLEGRLTRTGVLGYEEAVPIMRDILQGLAAIHSAGIIHRDLKPANIIFKNGLAVLCDFGMAHIDDMESRALSDEILGTPAYLAPEQLTGGRQTGAVDMYAAGVVFYKMLTGKLPIDDASRYGLLKKIATEPPVPITEYCDDIPGSLVALIHQILDKNPAERPSAEEALSAL